MNKIEVQGIEYTKPKVYMIQEAGLGVSEIAGRVCYDSFHNSENPEIVKVGELLEDSPDVFGDDINDWLCDSNNIDSSELLKSLSWVQFHHSVVEHTSLSYLIKGTSRGSLHETVRHRIASYSVRSTRYTMSSIINAFVSSLKIEDINKRKDWFTERILQMDMFVTCELEYNKLEISGMFDKLTYQLKRIGYEEFINISIAKSSLSYITKDNSNEIFKLLENGKKKRNIGDNFKNIVTDVWKVDMVVTFNLRSLKNFFDLRDSGSAYFQIKWLAQEMKKITPQKYLELIVKKK